MNSLYPDIAYTKTQEGNTLYIDINNDNTSENFIDEVLNVIFRFKTPDKKLIENLLNSDLSSLKSKSKNNNLLFILSISIPLILIAIIIIYIVVKKKYH
jgi:ATP-dependent Zn protease